MRRRSHSYDDRSPAVVGPSASGHFLAVALASLVVLLGGCSVARRGTAIGVVAPPRLPFAADTVRSTLVAPGVVHHYVHAPAGPWAIHLLEVDRAACWSVRAVKAHGAAVGREPTSALLRGLAGREQVVAGVNADFFSFVPPGVPMGAHVEDGRLVTGPGGRPVIGFDSAGTPFMGVLRVAGSVSMAGASLPLDGWNRVVPKGLAVLDRGWGALSDTGSGRIEVAVAGAPLRVVALDTLAAGIPIPPDGSVLLAGRDAPDAVRRALRSLHVGDSVAVARSLSVPRLRDVVGGRPVILRDSVITADADSTGATFAPVRHPRTAVGLARGGRELLVVVVDGRQKPYSDGMTLRELAGLFRALGARDAINLDGGGSSTFVLADSASGGILTVRNRPSDKTERPVANALAIVHACQNK